jgi:hypothetical protein
VLRGGKPPAGVDTHPEPRSGTSPHDRHGRSTANSCAPARQLVNALPGSCAPFPVRHVARNRALTDTVETLEWPHRNGGVLTTGVALMKTFTLSPILEPMEATNGILVAGR